MGISQNYGTSLRDFIPNSGLIENFALAIATASRSRCQASNSRRCRRRSSLLTTPVRQSMSRGCLLQVGQL